MKLKKDVFRALVAVAWADGEVAPTEADALLRVVSASGLTDADVDDVERFMTERVKMEDLPPLELAGEEAEHCFAMACMMSAADGTIDPAERAAVASLGERLSLSQEARERAAGAAVTIGATVGLSEGVLRMLASAADSWG